MQQRISMWMLTSVFLAAMSCSSGSSSGTSDASLKAPTNLKAEPLDHAAHLTWTDNSDEAEFMIERMTEGSAWMSIASVPFDTTQYHDAGVDPSMTYMYRVIPMGKDGTHGPASNEATCMPLSASGAAAAGSGHTGH